MATGQSIVEDALLELGIGSPGGSLSQGVLNHGLRVLNRMWSSWSAELGAVYANTVDTHTWPADTASQTIGSGGDIDTVRPIDIVSFQMKESSVEYTLREKTFEEYQQIILKTSTAIYPWVFAYSRTYPLATIYVYPTTSSAVTATLTSKKALTAFTMAGTIALPDGYELAIQKNLALELAPTYGKSAKAGVGTLLFKQAMDSKAAIVAINQEHAELCLDPLLPGTGNYYDNINLLTND